MTKAAGKHLEAKFQEGFAELQKRHPIRWLRLYDSHSAGLSAGNSNYLPEQDGDFIIITEGGKACLVECKESAKHGSLKSWLASAVSSNQRAAHRFWYRARAATVFVHYSQSTNVLEVWAGADVFKARNEGVPLRDEQVLLSKEVKPADLVTAMGEVLIAIMKLQKERF